MPEFTEADLPLLLTVAEVQRLVSVSRATLYKLIDDGKLTRVKIGRSARITTESMRKMLADLPAA